MAPETALATSPLTASFLDADIFVYRMLLNMTDLV
jgi:hypothetical protein